jgi:DNA-directed RNA polymerase subunit K/omega
MSTKPSKKKEEEEEEEEEEESVMMDGEGDEDDEAEAEADPDANPELSGDEEDEAIAFDDQTDFLVEEPDEELCDYEVSSIDATQRLYDIDHSASHTTDYITKFEKTRVLGLRSQHIKSGAPSMLRADERDAEGNFIFPNGKYPIEPFAIALKELELGKCPIIIGRRFPNGDRIMIPVSKLKLI